MTTLGSILPPHPKHRGLVAKLMDMNHGRGLVSTLEGVFGAFLAISGVAGEESSAWSSKVLSI